MLELLVRLECARERLRRRSLKSLGRYGNSYFAIALIVLFAGMMTGPLEFIIVPVLLVPLAVLFFFGLIFVISIVLLPTGLLFW